jgi:hypothetical protein
MTPTLTTSSKPSQQKQKKNKDDRVSPTSICRFPIPDGIDEHATTGDGIDYEYTTHDDRGALQHKKTNRNGSDHQELVRVDSIEDESFQYRKLEHPLAREGSDTLGPLHRIFNHDDNEDDQSNTKRMSASPNHKRSWSLPQRRIGSMLSVGSTSVAESEDDDYYNNAIIRKFEASSTKPRPVGIRRDISNDRLFKNYRKNPLAPISSRSSSTLVDDPDSFSLDESFWKDLLNLEPKEEKVDDEPFRRRTVSSILVVRPPSASLPRSFSEGAGGTGSVSSQSSKKVAFNDKMQVRYFERTQEERDDMRKYAMTRKRKKKSRKNKNGKRKESSYSTRNMLCKSPSLLETIDDSHDEEHDNKDLAPEDQGFEAIWDGSTLQRTSSNGSSQKRSGSGKMFNNSSKEYRSMRRLSSFSTKIVADLQLMRIDIDEVPNPMITTKTSSAHSEPASFTNHHTPSMSSDPSIDSKTSLLQGVFDDLGGMFHRISLIEAPKQQHPNHTNRSKSPLPFRGIPSAKSLVDEKVSDSNSEESSTDGRDYSEYDEFGKLFSNYFLRNDRVANSPVKTRSMTTVVDHQDRPSTSMNDDNTPSKSQVLFDDDDVLKRIFSKRRSNSLSYTSDEEDSWLCTAFRCG